MDVLEERQLNQAAYRRMRDTLGQTFLLGRFVAISGGKVVADADGTPRFVAGGDAQGRTHEFARAHKGEQWKELTVSNDDPEVRTATRDFLSSKGYEVAVAEGGREALRLLAASPADVVLLDVAMPDMDGMETLKRIVTAHPDMPVIMVTANADIEITSKVLQLGAADYVPKPFDLDYLDQAISIQLSAGRG